jgi:hypothetical protein
MGSQERAYQGAARPCSATVFTCPKANTSCSSLCHIQWLNGNRMAAKRMYNRVHLTNGFV